MMPVAKSEERKAATFTHFGVRIGLHAGSSCCVNLESEYTTEGEIDFRFHNSLDTISALNPANVLHLRGIKFSRSISSR